MLNIKITIDGAPYMIKCLYVAPIPQEPFIDQKRIAESLFISSVCDLENKSEMEPGKYFKSIIKELTLKEIHKIIGN